MYVREREEMREGRIKSVEERRALTNGRDALDGCTFQMLIAKLDMGAFQMLIAKLDMVVPFRCLLQSLRQRWLSKGVVLQTCLFACAYICLSTYSDIVEKCASSRVDQCTGTQFLFSFPYLRALS
jgi:hypothetical protein